LSDPLRLQQRIQRYGWDLAADSYESLWQAQLADAQTLLHEYASLRAGQRVLDVACGTGLSTFDAAVTVGTKGSVTGIDLSGAMVETAKRLAQARQATNTGFLRMDAQRLEFADGTFDAALCALGLMYVPDPLQSLREMRRVVRPGGEVTIAVWGERARCAWASVFPIVDAEVRSEVCPMFFHLGSDDALAQTCAEAGLEVRGQGRLSTTLCYDNAERACDAAFIGGPVALAWSRFDADTRTRVRRRYVESLAPWRVADGFRLPGEFVVVKASVPTAGY
jgi:ubiquinone/menaquinone biosynthesis C-methylase UbiE